MVSIVIPAFNEAGAIAQTVEAVRKTLSEAGEAAFEIVVVDDGSSDDTGRLARDAGAKVLRHPHNVGYGRALKTGIRAAAHDTVVITDSDGTYPIGDIPKLLARYREGFDMVVGARTGDHYRGSALKWPMRMLLRFLVEWTAGRSIPDINSGLRVFSRATMLEYERQLCETFSFTTSATLAYMMTGRFVTYLPIAYAERIGRTHVRLWRDSLRTLQYIVEAITYYNPLKLFLLLSLSCLGLAAVSVAIGIAFKIHAGFMMGVGAILVSAVLFGLGLLADLLRQIMRK